MDFLKDSTGALYRKFLFASVCSALVMSVYSFVDTIAVGQSEGTLGAAAMAVITPLYGTLIFIAILVGVGGSVRLGDAKGRGDEEAANAFFTASVLLMIVLASILWVLFALFHDAVFIFFGASEEILPKVMEYAKWIIRFFPIFIAPTFIGSFVRNDGNPHLAMAAVIAGGALNVFLDWLLVFPLGMGMEGAAVATVVGTSVQTLVMSSHFFLKRCTLRLVRPHGAGRLFARILSAGAGASVLDLGTVILPVLMNNQIIRYGGTTELAVYGVAATVMSLFQALFGGVGQAIQPLVSANHGAGNAGRNRSFFRMGLLTVGVMGIAFCALGEFFPAALVAFFVRATPGLLSAAPLIVRILFAQFPALGFDVLATYYLQSVMHKKSATAIALARSLVFGGLFLAALPPLAGIVGVWVALPLAEFVTAALAVALLHRTR